MHTSARLGDADLDHENSRFDRLLATFVAAFQAEVKQVELTAHGPGWQSPALATAQAVTQTELLDAAARLWSEEVPDDGRLSIRVRLDHASYDQPLPIPHVVRFGPAHPGRAERKRSDVVLSFGNRNVYGGNGTQLHSTRLTDDTVRDTLVAICHAVEPRALVLHCEQAISFPLSYHLVYHRAPADFGQDIAEIVRMSLHGGAGYDDGRKLYDSVLADIEGSSMLFGHRSGDWLDALKRFLIGKGRRIERALPGSTLEQSLIEDTLMALEDVDFFYTERGLGIFGAPLFDAYVEDFYLELMERLDNALMTGDSPQ